MSVNVIIFTLLSISICVVHSLNSDNLLNNDRSSEIKSNKLKMHESSKSRFNRLVEDESEKYKSRTATRRKPAHGYYYDSERLADGETEMRMFFGGVRARQTWVGAREGSPGGLVLAQATNGRQLVTLVYTGHPRSGRARPALAPLELRDCSVDRDRGSVRRFEEELHEQDVTAELAAQGAVPRPADWSQVHYAQVAGAAQVPPALKHLLDFRKLKMQCRHHHKQLKEQLRENKLREKREEERSLREQREGDRSLSGESSSNSGSLSRGRRAINDLFLFPGTLWCGNDHSAKSTLELSGHLGADACCRVHDFCPYNIPGVASKYGLFNSNFVTMSHCSCDKRFRTCLKASNTGASNLVGKIFFDVVATECFTFVRKKVCHRRNWWGKCQKFRRERRALVKQPVPWTR